MICPICFGKGSIPKRIVIPTGKGEAYLHSFEPCPNEHCVQGRVYCCDGDIEQPEYKIND